MKRRERYELFEKIKEACGLEGVKAVALEIEKNYRTLINELNADTEAHKLGLETFIDLLDNLDPESSEETLDWIVSRYGFSLVSMKRNTKEDLSRLLHKLDREVGDISTAYLKATEPGSKNGERISDEERERIRREAREAMEVIQEIHSILE